MALTVDTSRAPSGEISARKLVDAIVTWGDRVVERYFLEVKDNLDLAAKKDQAKLAKYILGSANRMPDRAKNAFEGYGVMVIGASKGSATGIRPVEALDIEKAVLPFIGADGPRYDFVRVPVVGSDNEVLVVLIDPPQAGQGPFICRKAGEEKLRDGGVFVRADGETREANRDELEQLIQRGRTSVPAVSLSVRLVGAVHPIALDPLVTLDEFITRHTSRLRAALSNAQVDKDPVPGTDSALYPGVPKMARQTRIPGESLISATPEKRTESEYLSSIDRWEHLVRAAWPDAVQRLVGAMAEPTDLEVTNDEKTFLNDVEVKVDFEAKVKGTRRTLPLGLLDLESLGFPEPPRPWGPEITALGMNSSSMQRYRYPVSPPRYPSRRVDASCSRDGSLNWRFLIDHLRPKGVAVADDEYLILYTINPAVSEMGGSWEATARDHHDLYSGTLRAPVGEPLDLTSKFRLLFGL